MSSTACTCLRYGYTLLVRDPECEANHRADND